LVAGFWILAALFLVAVASSAVPSPLYPVYVETWQLTPFMLAVYSVGMLLAQPRRRDAS
jgi:hypothetical protein